MRDFKKYFSVIVIGLVFVCMIPSVLRAIKESHKRNGGFDEKSAVEETSDVPSMSAPTETPEILENGTTSDSAATESPASSPASSSPSSSVPVTSSSETSVPVTSSSETSVPKNPAPVKPKPAPHQEKLPARAGERGTFVTGDASYFNDALFVGDSRTLGLCEYGTLKNADYYSASGMSVFNIKDRKSTHKPSGLTFTEFIKQKRYGKVYIMLGLNECGYSKSSILKKYQELINQIRASQPDAIIYIQANLLVTAKCSATDKYSHNPDLIEINNREAQLANGKNIMYIDVNNLFCLPDGTLDPSKTGDGTHIYAKYYADWCNWLMTRIAQEK